MADHAVATSAAPRAMVACGAAGSRGGRDTFGYHTHDCQARTEPLSSRRSVQVVVNDEPRELAEGATVADLVIALGLGPRRIAVEVTAPSCRGREICRDRAARRDAVEVINFVGGG